MYKSESKVYGNEERKERKNTVKEIMNGFWEMREAGVEMNSMMELRIAKVRKRVIEVRSDRSQLRQSEPLCSD